MAAGLGFKTFTTGDVLTAGDTNGYLMQGVWVFADAAARTAAVASPQEGNMSFLKDTNSTEFYDGSAWVAVGGAGGGKVLQVVSTFKDDTFTSSAANFADITGLAATITPSAATSKVLILSNINLGGTTAVNGSGARLVRGATAIGTGAAAGVRAALNISSPVGGDDDYVGSYSYVYLDSPATTSATTYKWQSYEQAGTTFVNRGQGDGNSTSQFRTASNIILLEIGA